MNIPQFMFLPGPVIYKLKINENILNNKQIHN
jgi:hypothetical protein